jgi:Membrane protease subunits, stomatin/prohibitin homologs
MDSDKSKKIIYEEIEQRASSGMAVLIINILLMLAALFGTITGAVMLDGGRRIILGTLLLVLGLIYLCIVGLIVFAGLKIIKPNEALVLTLFGKYTGTLKHEGFYFVNPFCAAVNPAAANPAVVAAQAAAGTMPKQSTTTTQVSVGKRISLKAMTLINAKQKINDQLGNPIEVGIVVIWRVVNTAMAVFNVDNFMEYLSVQCDSSLRNIVRMFPYDVSDAGDEMSLRGSSAEVAERIKTEIQKKAEIAGLEIIEARITHLAYAPEIAAAMLQRQQASAIIDARKMIVDGAVGMVEMALTKLGENKIVVLDDERKAAMVSNLLVVLCGNRDAQPVVNSGSLY